MASVLIIVTTAVEVLLFFIPPADIIPHNTTNSSLHLCDNHTMLGTNLTMPCLLGQLMENRDKDIPVSLQRKMCSQIRSTQTNNLCSVSIFNSSDNIACDKTLPSIPEEKSQEMPNNSLEYKATIQCQDNSKVNTYCIICQTYQTESNSSVSRKLNKSEIQYKKYSLTFWMYITVWCAASFINNPIWPLINAVAYASLGEDRNTWGRHRLWGKSHSQK